MNAANLHTSDRLQRVLAVLRSGEKDAYTTMDIVRLAAVCAVNSVISELRANGIAIDCRRAKKHDPAVWQYRLVTDEQGK